MATRKKRRKGSKKKHRRTPRQRRTQPRPSVSPVDLDERRALQAFLIMETLADEPEFRDFELEDRAVDIIAKMLADSDDDLERLEEAGDEEAIGRFIFEARLEAIEKIVTPTLKNDIRRRLERLSRRLRREGDTEKAESITTLTYLLDFPAFPWMLFAPLVKAFQDTERRIISMVLIYNYIGKAAGRPVDDLSPEELSNLLRDPQIASYIEAQYEKDEDLREFLDREFERAEEEFMELLFTNQIHLGLFTFEELALGIAWSNKALEEADLTEGEIQEEIEEKKTAEILFRACFEALSYLHKPDRRQQWLHRLEQADKGATLSRKAQAALKLLHSALSDPDYAEYPDRMLLCAYIGEVNKLQDQLSTSSSPEAQAQWALVQQIEDRLKAGEPPW